MNHSKILGLIAAGLFGGLAVVLVGQPSHPARTASLSLDGGSRDGSPNQVGRIRFVPGAHGAVPEDCVIELAPGATVVSKFPRPECVAAIKTGSLYTPSSTGHAWIVATQAVSSTTSLQYPIPGAIGTNDAGYAWVASTEETLVAPPIPTQALNDAGGSVGIALFLDLQQPASSDAGLYSSTGIIQPCLLWGPWICSDLSPSHWSLVNAVGWGGDSFPFYCNLVGTANPGDVLHFGIHVDESKPCNNAGTGCMWVSSISKGSEAVGQGYLSVWAPTAWPTYNPLVLEVVNITDCTQYPSSGVLTATVQNYYQAGTPWSALLPISYRYSFPGGQVYSNPGPSCPYGWSVDAGAASVTLVW